MTHRKQQKIKNGDNTFAAYRQKVDYCKTIITIFITLLTIALMLQCCVCLSSSVCDVCIVAKRCVLEQKLLLTAYRKSYLRSRLVPKWMTLTFV